MGKREHSGNPAAEAADLNSAIARSMAELRMQIAELAEDGNDKIGFQIALLEDASLVAPCWHLISNHASADGAWTATLDQQIEIFKSSGDEHVRARTCDLEEIRDRVLHQLVKM